MVPEWKKKRDIALPTKVHLVKAMVFPVVMYGCEGWTIKKAECQRIDPFELWCWRRLLRVPWTERRSNRSFLKEISPECSLEGLMLKLKRQYFGYLMWRGFFFKFLFLLYSALQYCIGFAIHWHESATGAHEFPILNPPTTSHPISSLWIISVHQPQASYILYRT